MAQGKLKVMTVLGTRPEIIRLSRVIAKLEERCNHVLVHTGQNYDYELNEVFFSDLGVPKPKHFLAAAGRNAAETIGKVIASCDAVIEQEAPEALLVLGDTNSCLAVIAAKRRKVPIFHMEAGNRCFDQRVPEEINRKIVDHTADINLPYSDIAREYLLREGLPADRVIKTGSPMYEVLEFYKTQIEASTVLRRLNADRGPYFLVSAHREENIEPQRSFENLIASLNAVAEEFGNPIIVSTHPRTQKRIDGAGLKQHSLIQLLKPLGFFDYVHLQKNARAVLSDSGTISEEASILGLAALNIREAHERPEGMEEAAVIMTGLSPRRILQALRLLHDERAAGARFLPVADYGIPNVSDKVVRIMLSYTDYVNRNVWRANE